MRLKVIITALVATLLAATVSVSPAYAVDSGQIGSQANPTGSMTCQAHQGATACFEKYGDKLWINNSDLDPRHTRNEWENWLWSGSEWILYRWGECLDNGVGWYVCNKDFYENSSVNYLGEKGSHIFWRACEYGQSSGWTCGGWRSTPNDG
ncbi:hypothetical protein WEI85_29670 [Actinomycetes bacterium KLBMP 9797]